jgi:hypothetical protein
MKLDLLTNATIVDDAIRFVSQKSKDKEELKSSSDNSNEDDKEELEEPDYNEETKEKQEQEKQEEQAGKITTNQFFELINMKLI